MDTTICLNMDIDANNRDLLEQIKALIASTDGAEVMADHSFAYTESQPVADGKVVYICRDAQADTWFLKAQDRAEIMRTLTDREMSELRSTGVVMAFKDVPEAYLFRHDDSPARIAAYAVEKFGFVHAPYRVALDFWHRDEFWSCHADQWDEAFCFAVQVPAAIYNALYGDLLADEIEFDGTLIEDRLFGRRTAYAQRQMASDISYRQRYGFRYVEPYFAA